MLASEMQPGMWLRNMSGTMGQVIAVHIHDFPAAVTVQTASGVRRWPANAVACAVDATQAQQTFLKGRI